ncbi:MAG: NAD(P)H-hydrate dehydratase [Geodermatophilaceae bacterium]|nr:NAD(P)H-hydrate dehydratase [Geodermatophilaceae bacterium]
MRTVPDGSLMDRAAAGLAARCVAWLPRVYGARVVVLAGTGSNGGDALFAGALLARRGAGVVAVALDADRLHAGGAAALLRAGGRIRALDTIPDLAVAVDRADLILDGIVGIGTTGALRAPADEVVQTANDASGLRVAVDLPSGVHPDTGVVDGPAFRADRTVTLGAIKLGLTVGEGREHVGDLGVVDIGLGRHLAAPAALRLTDADVAEVLPRAGDGDDKYSGGILGVAAGSAGYPGAAVLTVGAALRMRSSLVRYVGPAALGVSSAWPEALVSDGVPSEIGRVQAWAVGPGLGRDKRAEQVLADVLAMDLPVVVDADGLRLVARRLELLRTRSAGTVLTPHDREFADFDVPLGTDRLAAVTELATKLGVTVLLKGAATIVVDPDGHTYVNATGTAALASAGTGDVLTGIIGSLLAAGVEAGLAAALGAHVHGRAGQLAERAGALLASDVIEALPGALLRIRAQPSIANSSIQPAMDSRARTKGPMIAGIIGTNT